MEIGDSLNKLATQLNDSIHSNNNNIQKVTCVQLKLSYLNTARIVKEAFHEVNDILDFKLDKNLLDFSVRKEICANIKKAKFRVYGRCMQFDLIEVVDYVFLGNKMVIIFKVLLESKWTISI